MQQIKKHLSIFFLLLFLTPIVEKNVHAFEHASEIHCTTSDKHFHELEHTCSICDYTITNPNTLTTNNYHFIVSFQLFSFQPFIENVNTPHSFQHLPARAPPVI